MKIRELSCDEITVIYNKRLIKDFIKDELKKLPMILKAVDDGVYEGLGIFDDSEMIGYMFLVKQGHDYLIDYFAIFPEYRNKGLGGESIRLLYEYLPEDGLIILEVEDPFYTKETDLKDLQTRRIGFYERNGCRDSGLRARCFGVPFIILELRNTRISSATKLWKKYQSFYEAVFSREIMEKYVEYLGATGK